MTLEAVEQNKRIQNHEVFNHKLALQEIAFCQERSGQLLLLQAEQLTE